MRDEQGGLIAMDEFLIDIFEVMEAKASSVRAVQRNRLEASRWGQDSGGDWDSWEVKR